MARTTDKNGATAADVRRAVRVFVRENGSIAAAAERLHVSKSYLHDLARGRRTRPGPAVLRRLGFRRVVVERLERIA
jgi:hypothetical protein